MGDTHRLLLITIIVTICASWVHGQEVTCDPPRFSNGGYTPDLAKYRLGEVITYHCTNGFYPSTRGNKAKCTDLGWEPAPRCSFKPCEYPEIEHGELFKADRYRPYFPATSGQWYYYSCHKNYVTDSRDYWGVLTCTPKGWSPVVPCHRKCVFNYLQNGHSPRSERSYLQGQSIRVDCHPGYSLHNQQSTMTCTENGWNPPPECIRVETCRKSDVKIENGFLSESEDIYPLHKETKYRCQHGYVTEDGQMSGSITCRRGGWSAQPKCIRLCVMPVFENARAIITGKPFRPNDTLDYQCLDGFENTDGKSSGSMVCGEHGWSHLPTCFKSTDKCGPPPDISNGDITSLTLEVYPPSSQVEYQCQAYYELRGTKYVTCSQGKWSEPPRCEDVSCRSPPTVENAIIQNEKAWYMPGETVYYECTKSLNLYGKAEVTCFNGNWSKPPECKESRGKCGPPPPINNGDITTLPLAAYAPGSSVEYQCRAYYELQGSRTVTCRDGKWSEPPKCLDACVVSEEMMRKHNIEFRWKNAKIIYSRTDDEIEFRCLRGYRPATPRTVFRVPCLEGKVVYPTCVKRDFLFSSSS